PYRNLVIYDWDDTLFPTTWFTQNNLSADQLDPKVTSYFASLDKSISTLLGRTHKSAGTMIITNASLRWFEISVAILPKTAQLIKSNIRVFSARDIYKDRYPNEMAMWKRM